MFRKVVIVLTIFKGFCVGKYEIPQVTLEAYDPQGFRVSIPADNLTEFFGFHAQLNREFSHLLPGEIYSDVTVRKNGFLTHYNPELKLKKGDVIHYWYYVRHDQLGFKKVDQEWRVDELVQEPGVTCETSQSKISSKATVCKDVVMFEDDFLSLDETKWEIQEYLPAMPDFEFVLYKKDPEIMFINEDRLCIKPKFRNNLQELQAQTSISTDLGGRCTKRDLCQNITYLLKHPVVSGRLESLSFSYGDFEIKARVPSGDWIFPEIFLEDQQGRKILIAYTRGNQHLIGNEKDDLSNAILFGGPIKLHHGPDRNNYLTSYSNNLPLSQSIHVYRLRWTPELLEFFIDGKKYGEVKTESDFTGDNPSQFKLVLGVGVGGLNHFPDGCKSGEHYKPWKNGKPTQVLDFFHKHREWYPTWSDEGRQLQVEYVKVTAV